MSIRGTFLLALWAILLSTGSLLAQGPPGAPGGGMPEGMATEGNPGADTIIRKQPSYWKKASRPTAPEQLAYAEALEEKGRKGQARKAFDALVHTWHDTPEAVKAQMAVARLYEEDGKYEKAFDQYQYMVEYYSGRFPYETLLDHQFAIANLMRTRRTGRLLGFKGFKQDVKAVAMFEKLVENAPRWERTPEARLMIGMIYEDRGEPEDAIFAYEVLQSRHRGSDAASTAAFRAAVCRYHLAKRYNRDEQSCRRAMSALAALSRDYPNHPNRDEAQLYLDELRTHLADMYFDRAAFYDRAGHKPKAAVIAYSEFMRRFPESEHASIARDRLAALRQDVAMDGATDGVPARQSTERPVAGPETDPRLDTGSDGTRE